ncbi:hypothetical protein ACHAWO_003791 [Cyclotella atomus]|uniref:Uncharacterized protein n=1 Tax=Cyclotella atomus TaxID=382360 RepID=A0ABD3NUH2_9STRA
MEELKLQKANGSKVSSFSKQDEAEVIKAQAVARTWYNLIHSCVSDDVKETIKKYTSDVGDVKTWMQF